MHRTKTPRIFRFGRGQWTLHDRPYILGIMNLTPDSFSDGSPDSRDPGYQADKAQRLLEDGADGLDLGAESTRPGHAKVSVHEEWDRLQPILHRVRQECPGAVLSIDTQKAEIARRALAEGADIVNDIWGLSGDPDMAAVCGAADAGLIVMYNAHGDPSRPVGVDQMRTFFAGAIAKAATHGVSADRILVDPGVGFRLQGPSTWHGLTHLAAFLGLGAGVLVGHSRKRFLGAATGTRVPQQRDLETAVLSALVVLGGADVVRVHDPAATRRALLIAEQWRTAHGTD